MNIALDWDGTFTRDPQFYMQAIDMARYCGHNVYIVTSSHYDAEAKANMREALCGLMIPIVFTEGIAKAHFCKQQGIQIDNWWDDNPSAIVGAK